MQLLLLRIRILLTAQSSYRSLVLIRCNVGFSINQLAFLVGLAVGFPKQVVEKTLCRQLQALLPTFFRLFLIWIHNFWPLIVWAFSRFFNFIFFVLFQHINRQLFDGTLLTYNCLLIRRLASSDDVVLDRCEGTDEGTQLVLLVVHPFAIDHEAIFVPCLWLQAFHCQFKHLDALFLIDGWIHGLTLPLVEVAK